MANEVYARGFLALAAFALLVGCGGGGGKTPCTWPDDCGPPMAREMLEEILARAQLEVPGEGIEPADLQLIELHVPRCLDPGLTNGAGRHVCDVIFPAPCAELRGIWENTEGNTLPADPTARREHWHTIAQELESFPSGS